MNPAAAMAPGTPLTPRLVAEGLAVAFDGRTVLGDASLAVRPGAIAVLEGPSGCGKSTFLRMLAGLTEPLRGRRLLDGEDALAMRPEVWRRRVAYVFQQPPMFDGTVADNLRAGPKLAGRSLAKADVEALARRVGLDAALLDRAARSLSGGEQMRVAIARALANDPGVLLLDEPTAALDPASAATVLGLVRDLAGEGVSVVVVTHSREHAEALGGTRYVVANGRLDPRPEDPCTP